jgi:phage anti-repressor protein
VFLVRYELGFYIPEYGILYNHSRENLKSYKMEHFVELNLAGEIGISERSQCPSCLVDH